MKYLYDYGFRDGGGGLDTPPTEVEEEGSNSLTFGKLFQIYFLIFMSMFNSNILFNFKKHEHFDQNRDKLSKVCFNLLQCSLKYLYLSLSHWTYCGVLLEEKTQLLMIY